MNQQQESKVKDKSNGRIYTPEFLVKNILDMSGYSGPNILQKHVVDNSCGDGAFLTEIVTRYCECALRAGIANDELCCQLSRYIHGIEIDAIECEKCKKNLNTIVRQYNIFSINWDVRCSDALTVHDYDNKMDYVLGNPPYVRIHNIDNSFNRIKDFSFAQNGMTDLYIVFYEIGLKMLNNNGVLGYITPSSLFNSVAGKYLRKYLNQNNLIDKVIDLKHYQAFDATTYTSIMILKKNNPVNCLSYYQFDDINKTPYFVSNLTPNDYFINDNFYFADIENLQQLKEILNNTLHCEIEVKNGYATLCDDVFINDFDFESKYIIPVIKASTGKLSQIFYPYDKNSKLIPESELQKESVLYKYLLENRELLHRRKIEKSANALWYAFGRSQAIHDTYRNKLTINTMIRTTSDIKILHAPVGVGVYSGLYLVGETLDITAIKKMLLTDDFISYISLLGKYKSGGYYTFSSKDLKAYLDFKLTHNGEFYHDDKQRISQCC